MDKPAIRTTHGMIDPSQLQRTLGFEDRPREFVVWVEWRLAGHDGQGCPICAQPGNPKPDGALTLVRRDAHVILKDSPIGEGIAGKLGS